MSRFATISIHAALVLTAAFGAVGCQSLNRIPKFESALITPPQLRPGESAIIAANVNDHFGIVRKVEGVVVEDRRVKLRLLDDGVAPDEKAEDGIWTLKVDVPVQAPPGEFNLEIAAYDSKGLVVIVPGADGAEAPLVTTCKLVIAAP